MAVRLGRHVWIGYVAPYDCRRIRISFRDKEKVFDLDQVELFEVSSAP